MDIDYSPIVKSRAEPSRAEPSRAEPSRAEPSRGGCRLGPDARPGRSPRARPSLLLPALALLLGTFGLPGAAQAQDVPPTAPQNVVATVGDAKITLTWEAPSSWGNGSANSRHYVLLWKLSSADDSKWASASGGGNLSSSLTSYEFTGAQEDADLSSHTVTNGTSYDLRIRARTNRGVGSPRVTLTDLVPAVTDPPGPPVGLAVTPGATRLDLAWTAPSGTVSSYDVHYTSSTTVAPDAEASGSNPANAWVDASHTGTSPSLRITGLTNNTAYRVRARGVNSVGDGAWAWGTGTPKSTTSGSTDASLSGLVLATAGFSSATNFTEETLSPSFGTTTYAYTSDVVAYRPFAKVTPTVNESNATVKVNGTTVASDEASGAIELAFGANRIMVEVTAQAGNTRNYAITVNRALPTVAWPAATLTQDEGFGPQPRITPSWDNTMSGTFSYADGTATIADDVATGRTTAFTMSVGDTYLSAINIPFVDDALNEEDETFTVTIEPGTGYTVGSPSVLTVTIRDNDPPAAPVLALTTGNAELTASWTKPDGPVTGYQTRWKETAAADQDATTDGDPSTGWVEGGAVSSSSLSQTITGLTNGTGYDVQVRATDGTTAGAGGDGYGGWSLTRSGTPSSKIYGFTQAGWVEAPGTRVPLGIILSEAAPSGGLALTITRLLGTSVPTGLCDGETRATAEDIGQNAPTSFTVGSGNSVEQFVYPLADNGDDLVGGGECFALQLGTSAAGWAAGSAVAKMTISRTEGLIAMGSNAAATAKYTATVAENVAGGTLSVPVTVDHLPNESTTFTIEVLSGGTATEDTDFSIGTKSVTFGPTTPKTQNLTVTITNDAAVEGSETIELGIAAGTTSPDTLYTRDANGRLAQITITSEDAVPGAVTNLDVSADSAKLDLTWSAPTSTGSSAITGYDVHYTSATASAVPNGDPASGNDPAAGWVAVTRSGTTASQSITGLTNDTAHRVRVRAVNAVGAGAWEFGAGTTAYTATAPNAATHVKVRPTAAHGAATVTVNETMVGRGQESAAIVLGATGSTVAIRVMAEDATTKDYSLAVARRAAVTLDASPNPVPEGSDVTVTARLSSALGADVEIPLSSTAGTAEAGDFSGPASITITAGATAGTGTFTTVRDDDQDDETFTVSLGASLPSSVEAGTPSSVEVRIADVPSVSLEASPVEVEEGERVTVTARLSRAIGHTVTIPVTTTRGTSESGDHGTLVGILISSGATSGEGTITTRKDNDLEDETFTVAVRDEALPSPLVPGSPTSVEVFIVDIDTLSITLRSSTLRPSEGSSARLTATLSHPAPEGGVTVQFTANGSGDNPAAPVLDYTLDPPSEAQNATAAITIAEGQRTARPASRGGGPGLALPPTSSGK